MIRIGDRLFIQTQFDNEKEIEDVVNENAEFLFGPSLVLVPKSKISTGEKVDTIPDGFVIDFSSKQWFIVEAELSAHDVWQHIAKQISKQLTASLQDSTRERLIGLFFNAVNESPLLQEKILNEGIQLIQIHRVISEILKKDPIIGIPIDSVNKDLKDYTRTLRYDVRLWEIKKFVDTMNPKSVLYQFPEEFKPAFESREKVGDNSSKINQYEIDLRDLMDADFLHQGDVLYLEYTPINGTKHKFESVVLDNGDLNLEGSVFTSPSYAALACIKKAGSNRETVNGWTSWKTKKGIRLSELREQLLSNHKKVETA